jgi:hypothetical protein
MRFASIWLTTLAIVAIVGQTPVLAADKEADTVTKTYAQAIEFLSRHTKVIELKGEGDTRVAICPEYQGRIMTSSCAGPAAPSLGWINYDFIQEGKLSPVFNNYGGEDRFWLGPEGGQFGLWFQSGLNQTVDHWFTPPALNTGAFQVDAADAKTCRLSRRIRVTNVAEYTFDVDVSRELRLLDADQFGKHFSADAAKVAKDGKAKLVAFESVNTAKNVGPTDWAMRSGLVSIWTLGQFPTNDATAIIVPYKAGSEADLGPVVQSDYFGDVPADRLKITPQAVLFRGDGKFRSKLGISQTRAVPFAGAIDFKSGVLTLVQFSVPADPAALLYVNNTWKLPQEKAYAGDVFNSYNDGPAKPGAKAMGGFYELETLSPTRPLVKGESLTHNHRTFHFQADADTLAKLAKATLGVDLDEARKFVDQEAK